MKTKVTVFKTFSAIFVLFIATLFAPIIGPSVKGLNMTYDDFLGLVSTSNYIDESDVSTKPPFLSKLLFNLPSFDKSAAFGEMEDVLMSPLGVVKVSQPQARVRTSVDLSSEENVAWKANVGDRFVVVGTDMLGDVEWYKILKPGALQEYYYISSVVTTVMATSNNELDSEIEEYVEEMLKSYYDATKEAYKKQDFSYKAPYLIENTKLYNSEYNYLTSLTERDIAIKFNGYQLMNALYVSDTQVWVRVLEAMETLHPEGENRKKYYMSEYLINVNHPIDYRYYEVVTRLEYIR